MNGKWLTQAPPVVHLDTRKVAQACGRRVMRQAIFTADMGWRWDDGRELWLQRGFPNDGGSIPGLGRLVGVDSFEGAALPACGGHDAYYTYQDRPYIIYGRKREMAPNGAYRLVPDPDHPAPARLTREEADEFLLRGMQANKSHMAKTYHRVVRLGGGFSWNSPDSPLAGAYAWAVMTDTLDRWVEYVIREYGPDIPAVA